MMQMYSDRRALPQHTSRYKSLPRPASNIIVRAGGSTVVCHSSSAAENVIAHKGHDTRIQTSTRSETSDPSHLLPSSPKAKTKTKLSAKKRSPSLSNSTKAPTSSSPLQPRTQQFSSGLQTINAATQVPAADLLAGVPTPPVFLLMRRCVHRTFPT